MLANILIGGSMSRPRISVVIPAYNEESMIGACLHAVLAQSRPAAEVIVVDNNSTDRTAEIRHDFRDHVTVLREERQGVQHARNRGLNAATGPVDHYDVGLPRVAARGDALVRGLWTLPDGRLDWIFGANMAIRRPIWEAVAARLCADERFHEDLDLGIDPREGGYSGALRPAPARRHVVAPGQG